MDDGYNFDKTVAVIASDISGGGRSTSIHNVAVVGVAVICTCNLYTELYCLAEFSIAINSFIYFLTMCMFKVLLNKKGQRVSVSR